MSDSRTILFSTVEAVYLGCLLGANTLMGFPDPFPGWLSEEVEAALTEARDHLLERGVIKRLPDSSLQIDPLAATVVQACGFSDTAFILNRTHGTDRYFYAIHFMGDFTVEQVPRGDAEGVTLTLLTETDSLPLRILEFFDLGERTAEGIPGASIPAGALEQIRTLAFEQGPGAAADALRQAGVAVTTANAFAGAVASPVSNGALVAMKRAGDDWDVDGAAYLEGSSGLWQLRATARGDEDWVEVAPCSAEALSTEILGLLKRTWPMVATNS